MHLHYLKLLNLILFSYFVISLGLYSICFAKEEQPIMGAGPSTVVVQMFVNHFSKLPVAQDYNFSVPTRSIKHAGGIRSSEKYIFGRTGRPLNSREQKLSKHEIILARIPLSFVVGKQTGVKKLTMKQIEEVFTRQITNWKDLGGSNSQILLIGREPTEAAFSIIKQDYPLFRTVQFDLSLTRDHQVINLIKSSQGDYAISFGARANFDNDNLLLVDNFRSGVSLGLVYDSKNTDHPVVRAAAKYASSEEWKSIVLESGFLPPHN